APCFPTSRRFVNASAPSPASTATSSASSTASPSSSRKPCRSTTSCPWAPAPFEPQARDQVEKPCDWEAAPLVRGRRRCVASGGLLGSRPVWSPALLCALASWRETFPQYPFVRGFTSARNSPLVSLR